MKNNGLSRAAPEIVEQRQEAIARLRVRGYSERQIAAALPNLAPPIINPSTGKPWSRSTIQSDLAAVVNRWRKNAQRDIAQHQAEQLALLSEVQSQAWREKNLDLVLKSHDRISKLLGTNAPDRVQVDAHISADVLAETERRLIILAARADGLDAPQTAALDATALSPALPSPEAATRTGSPPNADDENE